MPTSRASYAESARKRKVEDQLSRSAARGPELVLLILASLAIVAGLVLIYAAKAQAFKGVAQQLTGKQLVNLNELAGPYPLLPLLAMFPSSADQQFVATRIYDASRHGRQFENAGAILRLRVSASEIERQRSLVSFPRRLVELRRRRAAREQLREAALSWFGPQCQSPRSPP